MATLKNILSIIFLIIGSLMLWTLSNITKRLALFNLIFFWQDIKYYTLLLVSIFFIISSLLIYLKIKTGVYLAYISLIFMMIIAVNKLIADNILKVENENSSLVYIPAFLMYLVLFLFLKSNKIKTSFGITNGKFFFSIFVGILISIPNILEYWNWQIILKNTL
jgi:hypothetical protein